MNANERCETCQFFEARDPLLITSFGILGLCRRYAPTIVIVDNSRSIGFPYVHPQLDWCGEYEQK